MMMRMSKTNIFLRWSPLYVLPRLVGNVGMGWWLLSKLLKYLRIINYTGAGGWNIIMSGDVLYHPVSCSSPLCYAILDSISLWPGPVPSPLQMPTHEEFSLRPDDFLIHHCFYLALPAKVRRRRNDILLNRHRGYNIKYLDRGCVSKML